MLEWTCVFHTRSKLIRVWLTWDLLFRVLLFLLFLNSVFESIFEYVFCFWSNPCFESCSDSSFRFWHLHGFEWSLRWRWNDLRASNMNLLTIALHSIVLRSILKRPKYEFADGCMKFNGFEADLEAILSHLHFILSQLEPILRPKAWVRWLLHEIRWFRSRSWSDLDHLDFILSQLEPILKQIWRS